MSIGLGFTEEENLRESAPNKASLEPSRASQYLDQIKATFTARSESYQQELLALSGKLSQMEQSLQSERSRYENLRLKFDNLTQLSENDQLHIKNLEAKITRLTEIVFATPQNGNLRSRGYSSSGSSSRTTEILKPKNSKSNSNSKSLSTNTQVQNDRIPEFISATSTNEVTLDAFYKTSQTSSSSSNEEEEEVNSLDPRITDKLDELLNSLPSVPK